MVAPESESPTPNQPDAGAVLFAAIAALVRAGDRPPHPAPATGDRGPAGVTAPIGESGLGAVGAIAAAEHLIAHSANLGAPGFFAHMDPAPPPIAQAGALWAAATNQNLLHHDTAPNAIDLEAFVIEWLAPFFGADGGHMVPGSSVANLTALWVARELTGAHRVVASEHAHLSVKKAAAILGLTFEPVEADEHHRMVNVPADLSDAILVATAGTTAVGAVDELTIGETAWRHVDAAWAGPLRLTDDHGWLLAGIDQADSVAVSAHKWLYQPKESAVVLFRDAATAHEAVSFGGAYLARPNVGVLGSHGQSALPLYLTLLASGRQGMSDRIEADLAMAARLANLVAEHPGLELWGPSVTGVVAWRPNGFESHEAISELRSDLQNAFVSSVQIDGTWWLRSVAANPNADPQLVIAEVLAAAKRLTP